MSSREEILGRIRSALGRAGPALTQERREAEEYLLRHAPGPKPRLAGDRVARFRERAQLASCTVDEVRTLDGVPQALARYLDERSLPRRAVIWPELAGLGWREQGIEVEARRAREEDPVGISGAFCAIAETGTLVLLSGPQTPASVSLVPETHVAVVLASRIVADMEQAFALLREERGVPPRAVNFVSGPSRTADIEQTVILGAHGPYRVHLILVGKMG